MQLQDDGGNECDVPQLRWGPDGTLGPDELERAIDEELVGREGCEVGVALLDDGRTPRRQAQSLKTGGTGMRRAVHAGGRDAHLFHDDYRRAWFAEAKKMTDRH